MTKAVQALKPRHGLYGIAWNRLQELNSKANPDSGIIRFPIVFEKLCRGFSITKSECWGLLFLFKDCDLIQIVAGQGIRVKRI